MAKQIKITRYFYQMEALAYYTERKKDLTAQLLKTKQYKSVFAALRLGSIVAVFLIFYFLWNTGKIYAVSAAFIMLIIFIRLVHKDLANSAAAAHLKRLIGINEDEINAVAGKYFQFDDGKIFTPHEHFYANDMDVFGHASLYQFINRTTSEMGAQKLADWLLHPADKETILQRQAALATLMPLSNWRQNITAIGKKTIIKKSTLGKIANWLQQPSLFLQFKPWQWLRYLLPLIILGITAMVIFGYISLNYFYGTMLISGIIGFQINKIISPLHEQLSKIVDELEALSESIAAIESQSFQTTLLQKLKNNLQNDKEKASATINQLQKILDRLDIRYNIVISAPLNLLLFWNLQQVLDLENWKNKNTSRIDTWFDTLANIEALNSLTTLQFNNKDWCIPVLHNDHFFINAKELGHPLIPVIKRINNYISINEAGKIMVVTGSNMAGKSTYLRSLGINVILAMAGAPACATAFEISPVQLLSSMRIADNLEESTSTFYAELKKLKTVIEKINAKEKVFVLLDEILRGTNSLDRHTGSEALIQQLIKQNAAAIIATHDLALADLKNIYPLHIITKHFDVQVNGEELYFDYKLKEGVCTSMNASILMKNIGLEL